MDNLSPSAFIFSADDAIKSHILTPATNIIVFLCCDIPWLRRRVVTYCLSGYDPGDQSLYPEEENVVHQGEVHPTKIISIFTPMNIPSTSGYDN